jgi:esterase FrsA
LVRLVFRQQLGSKESFWAAYTSEIDKGAAKSHKGRTKAQLSQMFHRTHFEEVAMRKVHSRAALRNAALGVIFLVTASIGLIAQSAGPRNLEELKAETQKRVDRNVAPAGGLKSDDAREALANIHSLDRDEWAASWSAIADRYASRAKAEESSDKGKAQQDYLMAWRYYSFARWPTPNSAGKQKAYQNALAAFRNYSRFLDPPMETVRIPFEGKEITGYLRLPSVRPAPLVLTISALDSRKEESAQADAPVLRNGIGFFAVDMPGTGEAPIKVDVGAERMFSTVLDYLASRPEVDSKRILVRSISWSGYWAAKLAYIEKSRLRGVVTQGGPVDGYFTPEWQRPGLKTDEYLFDLFPARAAIYGVNTLDEYLAYGPKLSLKTEGYLGKPSAPMLIVNGVKDTQVPIADLYTMLQSGGSAKQAWVNPDGGHTGRSEEWPNARIFEEVILPWIKTHLAPDTQVTQAQRE